MNGLCWAVLWFLIVKFKTLECLRNDYLCIFYQSNLYGIVWKFHGMKGTVIMIQFVRLDNCPNVTEDNYGCCNVLHGLNWKCRLI